jgi:hypothetical protein
VLDGVARDRIPELVARLVAVGVRVHRVAPVEASLTDVYFALQPDGASVVDGAVAGSDGERA